MEEEGSAKKYRNYFPFDGKITFGFGEKTKLARHEKKRNVGMVKGRSWKRIKNRNFSFSVEKLPHLFRRNVAFAKSRPIYRIVGQISFDKSINCVPYNKFTNETGERMQRKGWRKKKFLKPRKYGRVKID